MTVSVAAMADWGSGGQYQHLDANNMNEVEDALAVIAARLGRDLHLLTPTDRNARRLYLTGLLKAAAVVAGRGRPLPRGPGTPYSEAARFGVDMIESTMTKAMTRVTTRIVMVAMVVMMIFKKRRRCHSLSLESERRKLKI